MSTNGMESASLLSLRRSVLFTGSVGLIFWLKTLIYSLPVGTSSREILIHQQFGTIGMLLLLMAPGILLNRRRQRWYWLFVDLGLSCLILMDLVFYRHFQDIVTWRSWQTAWHYLQAETRVWTLLEVKDILLFIDLILLFMIGIARFVMKKRAPKYTQPAEWNRLRLGRNRFSRKGLFRVTFFCLVVITGFLGVYRSYRLLEIDQPGITKTLYSKVYIAQSTGELEFRALDMIRLWQMNKQMAPSVQAPNRQELSTWLKELHSGTSVNGSPSFGMAKGVNVIVIQVESMPEFVIGSKVNGQEVTPVLNRLRDKSLYFDHYFEEIGQGGTSDAEFLSNVSLYPVSQGNAYMDYSMNEYVSLPRILTSQGYRTVAMEADQPGFWNIDMMFRSEGFGKILDEDDFHHDLDIGMGLADASMFKQGADYLEQLKQPFYAFQVTLSSHYPFRIPKDKITIDVRSLRGSELGDYLESIHYTDSAIGAYIQRLKEDGLWENSIIAIYGDHHTPFQRDNADLSRFLGYEGMPIDENYWLALQKVPLFIHVPGEKVLGNREITGGQADLTPTLLGLLGIDSTKFPFVGRDLLNSKNGLAIARGGIMVTDEKIYDVYKKQGFDLNAGEGVPWNPEDKLEEKYRKNMEYSDWIMRLNLQGILAKDML